MNRPCLGCGELTSFGPRCRACTNNRRAIYRGGWPAISRNAIAAHVQLHGWRCLGDRWHPAHESHDLTTDHVVRGSLAGGVQVMCRAANSAKAHRGAS